MLAAGAIETWLITVIFDVDLEKITVASSDCNDDAGENGSTGFTNRVGGSITDNNPANNEACTPLLTPIIDLSKTAGSLTDNDDGTWTVVYTVTATNNSSNIKVNDPNSVPLKKVDKKPGRN